MNPVPSCLCKASGNPLERLWNVYGKPMYLPGEPSSGGPSEAVALKFPWICNARLCSLFSVFDYPVKLRAGGTRDRDWQLAGTTGVRTGGGLVLGEGREERGRGVLPACLLACWVR